MIDTSAENLSRYQGYSQAFDSLPQYAKEATDALVWSWRNGKLSLAWVTRDLDIFIEVCGGQVPDLIADQTLYCVDLESLSSSPIRLYSDFPSDPRVDVKGYYFESLAPSAKPTQSKSYKKTSTEGVMLIDRYGADKQLISADEKEVMGDDPSIWGGPKQLLDIVMSGPDNWWLFRKQSKNQSYIRVY